MLIHEVDQNSDAWLQLRAGLPTASAFSKLLSGTGKESDSLPEYARQLGIELYKGSQSSEFGSNYHTRRGHELEPLAVEEYALVSGVDPLEVGFITDDDCQIGSSPDRLIGDDGVLEIKCLSDKEHYLVLEYFKTKNDIPPKYKPQLQGEMMVCERIWNDILFFHPDMPSLTHRVFPDDLYVAKLKKQIGKCLIERDRVLQFLRDFNAMPESPVIANVAATKSKLLIEV